MYNTVTDIGEIRNYLSSAPAVSFDFETAPDDSCRHEERAALDPHKSHIVGVSFSASEDSGIYIPIAHHIGENADKSGAVSRINKFYRTS